jgi:hypothetical protein
MKKKAKPTTIFSCMPLSLSLSLWRKGGEEENDPKLLVIIAARLEKSFVGK